MITSRKRKRIETQSSSITEYITDVIKLLNNEEKDELFIKLRNICDDYCLNIIKKDKLLNQIIKDFKSKGIIILEQYDIDYHLLKEKLISKYGKNWKEFFVTINGKAFTNAISDINPEDIKSFNFYDNNNYDEDVINYLKRLYDFHSKEFIDNIKNNLYDYSINSKDINGSKLDISYEISIIIKKEDDQNLDSNSNCLIYIDYYKSIFHVRDGKYYNFCPGKYSNQKYRENKYCYQIKYEDGKYEDIFEHTDKYQIMLSKYHKEKTLIFCKFEGYLPIDKKYIIFKHL